MHLIFFFGIESTLCGTRDGVHYAVREMKNKIIEQRQRGQI